MEITADNINAVTPMAFSGQYSCARVCPLLDKSGQRSILAGDGLSANDPKRTFSATNAFFDFITSHGLCRNYPSADPLFHSPDLEAIADVPILQLIYGKIWRDLASSFLSDCGPTDFRCCAGVVAIIACACCGFVCSCASETPMPRLNKVRIATSNVFTGMGCAR